MLSTTFSKIKSRPCTVIFYVLTLEWCLYSSLLLWRFNHVDVLVSSKKKTHFFFFFFFGRLQADQETSDAILKTAPVPDTDTHCTTICPLTTRSPRCQCDSANVGHTDRPVFFFITLILHQAFIHCYEIFLKDQWTHLNCLFILQS